VYTECTARGERERKRWSDPDGRLSEDEAKEDEEFRWVGRAWSDMYVQGLG
jgi:hypothetical protein